MNTALISNVTLGGLAATAFVSGQQLLVTNHDYIGGGILIFCSIVFFVLYELAPDSNKPTPPQA